MKSLAELQAIREKTLNRINLRKEEEGETTAFAEELEGVAPEMATADDLESAEAYAAEDEFVNETDIEGDE